MSPLTPGTLRDTLAKPTTFSIQIHYLKAKQYTLERPLNQPTLQDFAAKKQKKDDFHDELVACFDLLTF
jgi:hypothetical protein